MKIAWMWICLCASLCAAPGWAADVGTVTILEGGARVLRGTTWFKLAEGLRIQDGDIVEGAEGAQIQVELIDGSALNLVGPATLYASSLPARGGKLTAPAEFVLTQGWLKLAAKASSANLRLRTALVLLTTGDAVATLRATSDEFESFVETGRAKLTELGKAGAAGATQDVKADEFWSRAAGKPLTGAKRPPQPFVAAMPRHFADPLPSRAARFASARVQLVPLGELTYAEAAPWLASPHRRALVRRFQARLRDPAFRQSVESNIALYPEWDRILHPEKYELDQPAKQ